MSLLGGFVNDLSSALFDELGMSENEPGTLDTNGKSFGALGKYAKEIDRSAQRSYVESGVLRNIKPRTLEVLMQEPDVTVVIKKRMFSSLVENYSMDLMDDKEKLFIKASKRLFYNKCRLISAYERLTKIKKVSTESGFINDYALPLLFSVFDVLQTSPLTKNLVDGKTRSTLETLQRVKALSDPNNFTTWIIDKDLPYATDTGEGTGTFELTMVNTFNTSTSVKLGAGNGSITVEDPYKFMIITNEDIDMAISESTNKISQNNFIRVTQYELEKSTRELKDQLNSTRINRGVSRIRFLVNEETLLYKKIRAIIDEDGREIKFTFDAGTFGANLFSPNDSTISIDPSALEGINGLRENEIGLLKQILHNSYLLIGMKYGSDTELKSFNEETNYVRKKMRLHYANKPIIQPMDVVYIFVDSKTRMDSKIVQGLNFNYKDESLLGQLDNTIGNIDSMFDDIIGGFGGNKPGEEAFIEIEKNSIVGPDFPMWLWTLMRNDFTRQAAGTCVFVGPVEKASHNYNNGKYTLNVSMKDNAHYLEMGQVNIQPSTKVWNGSLYDPLTPFDLDFDDASGFVRGKTPKLLDENITLLNTGSVRSKLGRMRGKTLSEKTYSSIKDIESMVYGDSKYGYRRLYHDPDGFVYRWKEGIGSLTVYGSTFSNELGSFNNDTSPNITKDPFAGQDVMNVLSLLVTGLPYNFNTYMSNAVKMGKLNRDDLFNKGNSTSFFKGLTNDISEKNATWGNFIPFKKMIINERGYQYILWNQSSVGLISLEAEIQGLLRQRAIQSDLLTQMSPEESTNLRKYYNAGLGGIPSGNPGVNNQDARSTILKNINNLSVEIKRKRDSFLKSMNVPGFTRTKDGTLSIFGNDISFDTSITSETGSPKESKRRRERSEFRKKINYLTLRRLWKVKGNEDSNLFIVDDSYDKNFDIQAFEKSIIKVNLFNSTYDNVKNQVNKVRSVLGLEVFADSQGHIQVRPPQYNRMPKSVFKTMIQNKAEKGIRLFPKYLERLFFNRIEGLTEQLEILEDQIRLRAAALGKVYDSTAANFLSGNAGTQDGEFRFITRENTGEVDWNLRNMFKQNDPELNEDSFKGALDYASAVIKGPLNARISFSIATQVDIVNETIIEAAGFIESRITKISNRLHERGIQGAPTSRESILSSLKNTESTFKQTDVLKVLNDIAGLISERQRVIKTLSNSIRNLRQGLGVNAENSEIANSLLLPNLYQQEEDIEFPELLEHMLEDESVDDFGEGAGSRYVIRDRDIKSFSVTEKGPDHTVIQVDGKLETGLVNFPSSADIQGFSGNANAIGSAFAVDYDMWRMYGWRSPNAIQVPFFSNPETQCAPYAVYLLNLARKNIFTCNATVVGNEFIQPGEVYYIEDRDLLFYSDTISHSYTYGSDFSTTLEMTFGHNPGEYIPTHLDVIGNALYTNRYRADQGRNVRHGRADDSQHIATLVVENTTGGSINNLLTGSYGEANRKSLANILMSTGDWWPPSTFGKKLNIEVRVYKNLATGISLDINPFVYAIAEKVKTWILDPRKFSLDGSKSLVDDNQDVSASNKPNLTEYDISVVPIDLNIKEQESKSPSGEAWGVCRSILNSGNIISRIANQLEISEGSATNPYQEGEYNTQEENKKSRNLNVVLINQVIDIWVTFSTKVEVKESTAKKGLTETNSQKSLQTQDEIDAAAADEKAALKNR